MHVNGLEENRAVTVLKAPFPDYSLDAGLLSPDAKHITRYTFWAQSPWHYEMYCIRGTTVSWWQQLQ